MEFYIRQYPSSPREYAFPPRVYTFPPREYPQPPKNQTSKQCIKTFLKYFCIAFIILLSIGLIYLFVKLSDNNNEDKEESKENNEGESEKPKEFMEWKIFRY